MTLSPALVSCSYQKENHSWYRYHSHYVLRISLLQKALLTLLLYIIISLIEFLLPPSYHTNTLTMPSKTTYHSQPSQVSTSPTPNGYEMDLPLDLNSYTRTMRQHTQKQMELAMRSAKRRSHIDTGSNAHGRLDTEGSVSSMDSTH